MGRHYSYTQLSLYEKCPAAYKFRYRDKLPEPPSPQLLVGRVVHSIIEEYDRHLLRQGLQTDVSALPAIAQKVYWKTDGNQLGLSGLSEVMDIVDQVGQHHLLKPDFVVGVEEKIDVPLWPGLEFVTRIDRLEIEGKRALVIDYKTDHLVRPQTVVNKDPQLQTYAWAVVREYPQVEEIVCRLEFVRYGVQREVAIGRQEARDYDLHIRSMAECIENEKLFLPRRGEGCAWCGYAEICPARDVQTGPVVCTSQQDANQIAEELAILEKRVAARKNALKAWCSINGSVRVNGVQWGYSPVNSCTIEPKGFVQICEQHGLNPWPALTVDGRKIGKYIKNPDANAAIAAITTEDGGTRFGNRKIKEGIEGAA